MIEDSTKEELYNSRKRVSQKHEPSKIRTNALVKFSSKWLKSTDGSKDPLYKELTFVYLGDIPNMPMHCVIAGSSGKVYFGIHTNDLVELSEDET